MTMLNSIYKVDLRMLLWGRKSRFYPKLITCVRAISTSGDGYLQVLLPYIYCLILPELGFPFASLLLKSFALERCLYFILKNSLRRKRPPDIVPDFSSIVTASDKFSFPSGHTMAAFLLANLTLMEFGLVAFPIMIWAMGVSCSRVILGVHFPSDIIAGALLGTCIAQLTSGIY